MTPGARRKGLAVVAVLVIAGVVLGLLAVFKPDTYGGKAKGAEDVATSSAAPSVASKEASTTTITPPKIKSPVLTNPFKPANPETPTIPIAPEDPIASVMTDATGMTSSSADTASSTGILSGISNMATATASSSSSAATGPLPVAFDASQTVFGGAMNKANQLVKNSPLGGLMSDGSSNDTDGNKATSVMTSIIRQQFIKSMQAGSTCAPATGDDLVAAIAGTCTVITLVPGVTYDIDDNELEVTSLKVVIGNPLFPPLIDGKGTRRVFHVLAGGTLDVRFVRFYRGGGELINTIPVLRGGSVAVELGGTLNLFGCIFTNAQSTTPVVLVAPDLSRAVRIFGGQIFVAGGMAVITNCHFYTLQPGVLLREFYVVGGDILVGAGVLILTASTISNTQLFLNGGGVGFMLAQLAGVMVCSAVAFILNTGAIQASGAGILTFIGAGVGIFSGVVWNAALGLLAHFGAGVFLFNGAGVVIMSGTSMNADIGVGIECGVGIMVALGAGQMTITGATFSASSGVNFIAEAGVFIWVGSGNLVMTGTVHSRVVAVLGVYGIGGNAFNNGLTVIVGQASDDVYGVVSAVLPGGNWFQASGLIVEVGSYDTKVVAVGSVIMPGLHGFVGAGAASVTAVTVKPVVSKKVFVRIANALYLINGKPFTTANGFYHRERELQDAASSSNDTKQVFGGLTVLDPSILTMDDSQASYLIKNLGGVNTTLPKGLDLAVINENAACNVCSPDDLSGLFIGDGASACNFNADCGSKVRILASDGSEIPLPGAVKDVLGSLNSKAGVNSVDTYSSATAAQGTVDSYYIVGGILKIACTLGKGSANPGTCAKPAVICQAISDHAPIGCNFNVNAQDTKTYVPSDLQGHVSSQNSDLETFGASTKSDLWDGYEVHLITTSKTCADKAKQWLSTAHDDSDPSVSSMVDEVESKMAGLVQGSSVSITRVELNYDVTHFVPLTKNKADLISNTVTASAQGAAAPVVSIQTKNAISPIATFSTGDSSVLSLANFQGSKPVTVNLIDSKGKVTNVANLPQVDDKQDATHVPITFTNPGTYFVTATQGLFTAASQKIVVT